MLSQGLTIGTTSGIDTPSSIGAAVHMIAGAVEHNSE